MPRRSARACSAARTATYDGNNTTTLPGTFVCDESDDPCTVGGADTDADAAHEFAREVYELYEVKHGRDSLDGNGMQLISTVHHRTGYCNAFWNGTQMAYGDGCGTTIVLDDVVGHEPTHGVTEFTSNLVYAYESGAINESFSDIWGELFDLGNGTAEDIPANRWIVGEELVAGGIRNMKNPPLKSDPRPHAKPDLLSGILRRWWCAHQQRHRQQDDLPDGRRRHLQTASPSRASASTRRWPSSTARRPAS
ncbi:MAG: M4 family metallopeptidase [Chloroflexi bacterium]|nr:M4 family metallopeptidase [Chloroflexota bacterium]